ncbi:hypothetical protein M9H77_25251 [Catharanthus roseus]|uniref:Uncharacterized protein n=1 Tax=Catharanthus roseus TaxID=4058 RepID=A0ACC0A6D4_CATRO|nr:hypothetical protein M9H77_25251 [Catharanthus roseus]
MPNDLQLMATISGELSWGQLYGAGSEVAHLRAESSGAAAGLPPCCLEAEQRIMRRVETVISSVCATFDEHIRQFAEQSHLPYTLIPSMIDVCRAAMAAVPLTSSSTAVAAGTSNSRVSYSTPPPPSIDAPSTTLLISSPLPPPSSDVRDPEDV